MSADGDRAALGENENVLELTVVMDAQLCESTQNYRVVEFTCVNCMLEGLHANEAVIKTSNGGFPGVAVVESLPANAGDTGSSPGLGRSHMPRSN